MTAMYRGLVTDFRPAEIAVHVASSNDGTVYENQVMESIEKYTKAKSIPSKLDSFHPVLLLVPVKLGLDGLNSVYHPALKVSPLSCSECAGASDLTGL